MSHGHKDACEICGASKKNHRATECAEAREIYLLRQAGWVMPAYWREGMPVPVMEGEDACLQISEASDLLDSKDVGERTLDDWQTHRQILVTAFVVAGVSNWPARCEGYIQGRAQEARRCWEASKGRPFAATYSIGSDSYAVMVTEVRKEGREIQTGAARVLEEGPVGTWVLSNTGEWKQKGSSGRSAGSLLLGVGISKRDPSF